MKNTVLAKFNTVLTKKNTVLAKFNTVLAKFNTVLTKKNTAEFSVIFSYSVDSSLGRVPRLQRGRPGFDSRTMQFSLCQLLQHFLVLAKFNTVLTKKNTVLAKFNTVLAKFN